MAESDEQVPPVDLHVEQANRDLHDSDNSDGSVESIKKDEIHVKVDNMQEDLEGNGESVGTSDEGDAMNQYLQQQEREKIGASQGPYLLKIQKRCYQNPLEGSRSR